MEKLNITPMDITIVILFAFTSIVVIFISFNKTSGSDLLLVSGPHGEYVYNLNQKIIIEIDGIYGKTSIEIDNGRYRFIDSPCKNKTCINNGFISTGLFPNACLPNGVSAAMVKRKKTKGIQIDGVAM